MNTLSWLVDESFSTRLTLVLLHFLWQGCCIGLVVWIGGALLAGAAARLRYSVNVAALIAMAACLPVTFLWVGNPAGDATLPRSSLPIPIARAPQFTAVVDTAPPADDGAPSATELIEEEPRLAQGPPAVAGLESAERGSSSATPAAWLASLGPMLTTSVFPVLSRWIVPLYLAGVVSILGRLVSGVWGGHRLRRMALPIEDETLLASFRKLAGRVGLKVVPTVAWCEQISIPIVVGIVQPMILLPMAVASNLTPDQLQALMLHELSHIRRYDPLVNLLQRIVEALLFFHPAVWFVSRRISIEREHAADDMVLAAGWDRPLYADALLRMAELATDLAGPIGAKRTAVLAATGTKPSEFKLRILRLLDVSRPPKFALSRTGILLALSLLLVGGVLAWSQTPPRAATGDPMAAAPNDPTRPVEPQPIPTETQPRPETVSTLRTLRQPSLLLPDHWIVRSVGFDNQDNELVTVSTQNFATIRRWDLVGRKLISEIKLAGDVHGRAFREGTLVLSGDRRRVLAATDTYVGIWDAATGELLQKLPFPTQDGIYDCTIDKLDCTPDLSVIAGNWAMPGRLTLAYDAHVMIWDGDSGKLLQTVVDKNATVLQSMDLSTDGKRLATTNGGGAQIWDVSTGQQLLSVPNDNRGRKHSDPEVSSQATKNVWCVQFSPSGKQLAMGDMLGVTLVDANSGQLLKQLDGPHRYGLGFLVFSPDGGLLARLGTGDRVEGDKSNYVVPIWSTETGQKRFELHTESNVAAFSEDGQRLAVGFSDRQQALAVWTLGDQSADPQQPAGPGPESRQDKVEENGHYHGPKAAEFIDQFQPTWGDSQLGIQYGIALTTPQRPYRSGERVPLVAFFRNASDKPLKIDMRPDYFGNTPKVVNAQGAAVELENVPLLGPVPHYVENLGPGDAVGPFYLNFGLGENPRPGKQHWHPYLKVPLAGKYELTHAVSIDVQDGDQTKSAEVTSGTIALEIVADGQPAAAEPEKESRAAPPEERPNYVKVVGQLLDADTGKPIEKASWESGMASLEKPQEIAWGHSKTYGGSYPDGRFSQVVNFTPDGWFERLRVFAAGYEPTVVVDDLPNPRPLQVERTVRLKRGQTITGTLRDHTGKPVASGWVFFIPAGHHSNIVEGIPGADAYSRPGKPLDGAVAEARTDTKGQFVLSAASAGTLAASTDAVDLWPFELPDDGHADLTLPEPAHLVIDLAYWYLDDPARKEKPAVAPDSEDPNQCWIQVDRAGNRQGLWKSLDYRRQMLVFALDPREKLAKGVSVGPVLTGEWDKPIAGAGHNKNTATKIRIALPPGSYRVQRLKAGPFAPVDERNVELKSGAETLLDWARGDGAAVQGQVTWPPKLLFVREEGEAPRKLDWTVPDQATVTITNAEGQRIEAAKIQADGKFFIATHLEPGKYKATATVYLPERDFRGGLRLRDCETTQEFVIPDPMRAPSGSPPVNVDLSMDARGPRFVPAPDTNP
jgi:beta-lactamase regulating signal transducer with metallopeptidase domain/WD40 repeat protein